MYVLEGEELRRVALAVSEENPVATTLRSFSRVPVAAASPLAVAYRSAEVQVITRITAERDNHGDIIALVLRDDRHEERWDRRRPANSKE